MKPLKTLILAIILLISASTTKAQWTQIGNNINDESSGDNTGTSVCLSADGNIMAVGAPGNTSSSGHVRIYQNISNNWIQIGEDINGENIYDNSGESVSLSSDGSIVAIGAIGNDGNGTSSGQVRVFINVSNNWVQIGNDINGEAAGDYSGGSVSISSDGSIVAIGAPYNEGNGEYSGHVRIYQNISNNWVQIGDDIDGEAPYDLSGESVSLSSDGSIVAIGAPGNVSSHVRIYQNISNNWIQIGSDINGEIQNEDFGHSVSLSSDGSIVAIGAYYYNAYTLYSGHIRIFQNLSNNWMQIGSDIEEETSGYSSKFSVSLNSDGSIVAIGAASNDANVTDAGHVRIYQNISNNWMQIGSDINDQTQDEFFGHSVSLNSDGSIVAIGANGDWPGRSGYVKAFNYSCDEVNQPNLGNDTVVCENRLVALNIDFSENSFIWSTGETTTSILVIDTGYYYVTFYGIGCSKTDSIHVGNKERPNINLPSDTIICPNDTIEISVDEFTSYIWSTGDTTQTIHANSSGNYRITVTSENGCSSSDLMNISHSIINTELQDVIYACYNGEITITANPENSNLWSTGETTSTINHTVTNDTILFLEATNTIGCTLTDSVSIFKTASFTYGFENEAVNFYANSSFNLSYAWDFGDGNFAMVQNPTHAYQNQGAYEVCLITSDGCIDTICKTIEVYCVPSLLNYLPVDTFVYPNQPFTFEIDDIFESYLWSTGYTTNNVVIEYDSIPYDITEYEISISPNPNCSLTHSFTIEKYHCQEFTVSIDYSNTENNILYSCVNEYFTFHVSNSTNFYQNNTHYTQTSSDLEYYWIFDSIIYQGDSLSYLFENQESYAVSLFALDQYSCKSTTDSLPVSNIEIVEMPTFNVSISHDTISYGDIVELNAEINISQSFYINDTVPIPDEISTISYLQVGLSETIISSSNIKNICVNMEHSCLSDLVIEIECPNGTSVLLEGRGGGCTFLGEPNYYEINPGIGYDYCWTNNPEYGIMNTEASNYGTLPSGTYTSEEPLSNLIGCPTNGIWKLNISDNYPLDIGFIFSWGIEFDTLIIAGQNNFLWQGNNIDNPNISSTQARPTSLGLNEYTFTAENQYCGSYDTIFYVFVTGEIPEDTVIFSNTQCNNPINSIQVLIDDCSFENAEIIDSAKVEEYSYYNDTVTEISINVYSTGIVKQFVTLVSTPIYGTYQLEIIISCFANTYFTGTIIIHECIDTEIFDDGINDISNNIIQIYPNPAKDILNLQGFKNLGAFSTIKLQNTLGQTIYKEKINNSKNTHQINVSYLPKGIYFVFVQTTSGKFVSKVLIE